MISRETPCFPTTDLDTYVTMTPRDVTMEPRDVTTAESSQKSKQGLNFILLINTLRNLFVKYSSTLLDITIVYTTFNSFEVWGKAGQLQKDSFAKLFS